MVENYTHIQKIRAQKSPLGKTKLTQEDNQCDTGLPQPWFCADTHQSMQMSTEATSILIPYFMHAKEIKNIL